MDVECEHGYLTLGEGKLEECPNFEIMYIQII